MIKMRKRILYYLMEILVVLATAGIVTIITFLLTANTPPPIFYITMFLGYLGLVFVRDVI